MEKNAFFYGLCLSGLPAKQPTPQSCLDKFCFGSQIHHLLSLSVEFQPWLLSPGKAGQPCLLASQSSLPLKQWLVGTKVSFPEILPKSDTQCKKQIMTTWSALGFQADLRPGICGPNSTDGAPLCFFEQSFKFCSEAWVTLLAAQRQSSRAPSPAWLASFSTPQSLRPGEKSDYPCCHLHQHCLLLGSSQ